MKQAATLTLGIVLGALIAGGGVYWLSGKNVTSTESAATGSSSPERKILYYRNPMGLPDTSPTPKKDPMGMDYIPVFEGDDGGRGCRAPGGHGGNRSDRVGR